MIIAENRAHACPELLDQMYRLRADAFGARRGWRVNVTDGREVDRFDDLDPLYLMYVNPEGQLLASLRLLPTTGSHMLSDVFPELLGGHAAVRSPRVWESSRFCVDKNACRAHSTGGVNSVTKMLLEALCKVSNKSGMESLVSVYDVFMERILRRSGCIFRQFGQTARYDGGLETKAGIFDVCSSALSSIRYTSSRINPPAYSGQYWEYLNAP